MAFVFVSLILEIAWNFFFSYTNIPLIYFVAAYSVPFLLPSVMP